MSGETDLGRSARGFGVSDPRKTNIEMVPPWDPQTGLPGGYGAPVTGRKQDGRIGFPCFGPTYSEENRAQAPLGIGGRGRNPWEGRKP